MSETAVLVKIQMSNEVEINCLLASNLLQEILKLMKTNLTELHFQKVIYIHLGSSDHSSRKKKIRSQKPMADKTLQLTLSTLTDPKNDPLGSGSDSIQCQTDLCLVRTQSGHS